MKTDVLTQILASVRNLVSKITEIIIYLEMKDIIPRLADFKNAIYVI